MNNKKSRYPQNKENSYKYREKAIKRIPLDVQIEYYENTLKPAVEKSGTPVNTFIKQAIQEKIERDRLQ